MDYARYYFAVLMQLSAIAGGAWCGSVSFSFRPSRSWTAFWSTPGTLVTGLLSTCNVETVGDGRFPPTASSSISRIAGALDQR